MDARLEVMGDLAMRDIDCAVDYLTELLNKSSEDYARELFSDSSTKIDQNQTRRVYASALNTATRRLWKNTWKFEVSIDRAHKKFVPLLEQAASKINWKGGYFTKIRNSIRKRIGNLEKDYCCGVFLKKGAA